MTQVREFSAAGPCIVKGELVKETNTFFIYRNRFDSDRLTRIKKRGDLVHTSACPCCRDHAKTQYPNGYEN